ncbi:MAG: hypothetical protein U0931_27380 [Vulcanimicrobiota bacterium]
MKSILTAGLLMLALSPLLPARPHGSQVGQPDPPALSVTYVELVKDLRMAAANAQLSRKQLEPFFERYSEWLSPQLAPVEMHYPLRSLQKEPFYQALMQQLLNSKNANQRLLGYALLGAAGDARYNARLLTATRQEKDHDARVWAGMALLFLNDPHSEQLFDFVVANENWQDPHLLQLYLQRDPDSLLRVARRKMSSPDARARMLAVQSFLREKLDGESQQLLRQAVRNWEAQVRGYAIYVMAQNHMPELKSLLMPSLEVKSLRAVSLMALAASPTPEDQNYLASLPLDGEVLNAYLRAGTVPGTRRWLALLRQGAPEGYVFFVHQYPLLKSDELLGELQSALKELKDPRLLEELVRALDGRRDEASLDILLALLTHADSDVRYWTAHSMQGIVSPRLAQALPGLIRDPKLRSVALTELAVNNRVDGLRDVYRAFWYPKPSEDGDWRRAALEYLAAFPKPEDLELLRGVVANDPDVFSRRTAVEGLGLLKDAASVELIVAALAQEPAADANAVDYLEALGRIGGPVARAVLERYRNSRHPEVRALLAKYLQ